jgi:hypothetical protein
MHKKYVLIAAGLAVALPAAPALPAGQARAAISSDRTDQLFRKYDLDRNNVITPLEFALLLYDVRGKPIDPRRVLSTARSKAPNALAVRIMNETAVDFTRADRNGDLHLTREEVGAFLAMHS